MVALVGALAKLTGGGGVLISVVASGALAGAGGGLMSVGVASLS